MATVAKQVDTTFDIVTPENIAFEYKVAGLWQRLPAFAIDFVIRAVIFIGMAVVLMCAGGLTLSGAGVVAALAIILVARFLFEWFYGGLFETFWNGQTPGKKALSLRVVTTAGEPINGLQAILRNVLRFADAMPMVPFVAFATVFNWDLMEPPAEDDPTVFLFILLAVFQPLPTYSIGLIVSAMNPRRQRLGDLVCGTMVIAEEAGWMQGMVRMNDRRVTELATQLPPHLDVGRSTAKALAMYVERRQRFSPARRQEIAMHLGHRLIEKYHLPPVSDHDLLLCAVYYKVFVSENLDEERQRMAAEPEANPYVITEPPQIVTAPSQRRW